MNDVAVIDPDRPCPHRNFGAIVDVHRLINESDGQPAGYYADITVHCTDCAEPFRWTGLQAGLNPRRPMVSPDETELRAPLRPASADPDFGMGLPGFAITWTSRDE